MREPRGSLELAEGGRPADAFAGLVGASLVGHAESLERHADLLSAPITSHRPVLGRLTVGIMRLLRLLMTHVLAEQTAYNRMNLETVHQLVDEQARAAFDRDRQARGFRRARRSFQRRYRRVGELAERVERSAAAVERVGERLAGLATTERRVQHLEARVDELARLAGLAPLPFDYLRFTDRFRGSEDVIRERQRRYVELFRDAGPVLDVGCGRGEFLALLAEHGIAARGVDRDEAMVAVCRAKHLAVERGDVFDVLSSAADSTYGGIFAAQVVEHLAFPQVLDLLDLCSRKLRPGGIVALETLNPESLFVLYRWLWIDPTHRRLVHPETLRFCLEERGFTDLRIEYLPVPEGGPVRLPLLDPGVADERLHAFDRAAQYLNDVLYASTDYVVIGQRP